MTAANLITHLLLNYLLNALWQVPLLYLAARVAEAILRHAGIAAVYRLWVATLVAQVILPAVPRSYFNLTAFAYQVADLISTLFAGSPAAGSVAIASGESSIASVAGLHLPQSATTVLLAAYAVTTVWFAARLLWRMFQTFRLAHQAEPTAPIPALLNLIAPGETVPKIAISGRVSGPVTVGFRRDLILFPPAFLETVSQPDLQTVLAHERAHILRRDFVFNLLFEFLALPIAFHPALIATRRRLAQSREMLCDELAAHSLAGPQVYARSLVRLAAMLVHAPLSPAVHAIGILDASLFERRIMNLTHPTPRLRGGRKAVTIAACSFIALAACGSALALRVNVAPSSSAATQASDALKVSGGVMAGNLLSKKSPIYPPEAKANPLNGSVVLDAIIGKDGTIESLQIAKSLRADYDQSALDAVREWTYKPFLLNGEPTEVKTTITVTYSLAE